MKEKKYLLAEIDKHCAVAGFTGINKLCSTGRVIAEVLIDIRDQGVPEIVVSEQETAKVHKAIKTIMEKED